MPGNRHTLQSKPRRREVTLLRRSFCQGNCSETCKVHSTWKATHKVRIVRTCIHMCKYEEAPCVVDRTNPILILLCTDSVPNAKTCDRALNDSQHDCMTKTKALAIHHAVSTWDSRKAVRNAASLTILYRGWARRLKPSRQRRRESMHA